MTSTSSLKKPMVNVDKMDVDLGVGTDNQDAVVVHDEVKFIHAVLGSVD